MSEHRCIVWYGGDLEYAVRDLDPESEAELDQVTRWSMQTVLATVPELQESEDRALQVFSNFSFEAMRAMFVGNLDSERHRFLVVETRGSLVGHAMIFHKQDEEGRRFGYFFTRWIEPDHRRRGLASRLLVESLRWFNTEGATYLLAHTHATNRPLQALFEAHGFSVVGHKDEPWPTLTLRREL